MTSASTWAAPSGCSAQIPAGVAVVSESGIGTAEQLRELREAGVSAVLMGESLMRAPDPAEKLRSLMAGARGGSE